jgi:cell division protein FtsQ
VPQVTATAEHDRKPDREPDREPDVAREDSPEDSPVAPVIPFAPPADDPSEAAGTSEPPVRLRDVWAAARARRRALRSEVRRFTVRQRRRRMMWIGAAASIVALALVTLGAAYSPLFAVERIQVIGAERLDAAAVQAALADEVGKPLPLVDDSAVKAALVTFPLIESYTLEARPPHDLVVRIVERTPIGWVRTSAGYTLVDAAGVALVTARDPGSDAPLVTVDGGLGSEAFAAVGHVMRSLPEPVRLQVTEVEASSAFDVTLTLGGSNARVVWGSAEDSAMKALVLERAMTARPPAGVSLYDVSSPSAVVIR